MKKMIICTGSSGFIGKNICKKTNLPDDCRVDFVNGIDPFCFLKKLEDSDYAKNIDIILHNGACSSTTESDPNYLMKVNFDYSASLLRLCIKHNIRLIYASSASVYGDGPFEEDGLKAPKNLYALSKSLFDDYAMAFVDHLPQVVGLRYFNVYGPREEHKGDMASVMYRFYNQVRDFNKVKLFKNSDKYLRDFIYIDDVVNIVEYFCNNKVSGIYNVGTGRARSFLDIAEIYNKKFSAEIEMVPMPKSLVGRYQEYTQSDNVKIKSILDYNYTSLENGIDQYIKYLDKPKNE